MTRRPPVFVVLLEAVLLFFLLQGMGLLAVSGERAFQEGERRLGRGEYTAAAAAFGEVLIDEPRHREALLGRGQALLRLRKLADAAADYQQVLRLDPTAWEAYMGMALVYRARGNHREARAYLAQAHGHAPPEERVHIDRVAAALGSP